MYKFVMLLTPVIMLSACYNLKGPAMLGDPSAAPIKTGEACIERNWFSYKGDGSLALAKRNGDIANVATVDFSAKSRFPYIKSKYCTVVSGE